MAKKKIKLCWKWAGVSELKKEWLDLCAESLIESFDLYCEESEREELASHGIDPQSPGEDWGAGSETFLLAMIACGEAEAVIWIDEGQSPLNASQYALSLCREKNRPIAFEPCGAAAILSTLERVHLELGHDDERSVRLRADNENSWSWADRSEVEKNEPPWAERLAGVDGAIGSVKNGAREKETAQEERDDSVWWFNGEFEGRPAPQSRGVGQEASIDAAPTAAPVDSGKDSAMEKGLIQPKPSAPTAEERGGL